MTERDPAIILVPEAARMCGVRRQTFAQWLRDSPAFRAAVVVDVPSKITRISRPRLERWLHGGEVR